MSIGRTGTGAGGMSRGSSRSMRPLGGRVRWQVRANPRATPSGRPRPPDCRGGRRGRKELNLLSKGSPRIIKDERSVACANRGPGSRTRPPRPSAGPGSGSKNGRLTMHKRLERAITLAILAVALGVWMSGCAASSTDTSTGAGGAQGTQLKPAPAATAAPLPSPAATDTSGTPH